MLWASSPVYAEGFDTWFTMKGNYKATNDLTVIGSAEFRLRESFQEVNRWGVGLGAEYKLLSFLKAEAGYELHHRNRGQEGWKFRHRYRVGLIGTAKLYQFKISLRERFQQTFNQGDVQTLLRSRLEVAYEPSNFFCKPYFSVEMYQPIGHQSFWNVTRMRYRPGVDIQLPKNWGLDLFYCYQHTPEANLNIIGVECSYNF